MFQKVFHRPILGQEFFGGFFAYPRQTGYIVRSITHHAQVVPHLRHIGNLKPFEYFFYIPYLYGIAHTGRPVHECLVRNQLGIVFVRSHHIRGKSLFLGFFCQSSYDIVRFKTLDRYLRYVECFEYFLYYRHSKLYGFRSSLPLGFVLLEKYVAERRRRGVENGGYVARTFFAQYVEKGIYKTEHCRSVLAPAVGTHGLGKSVISPVYQGIRVE